ncbi:hypothetical protein [Cyanothece sp. BG0011]|uniref:hypothetical protein n=1 Tax=Cyanothece sp. BG0011 TaxID=2082950 RepID=UPI000D1F6896|nr:hypothetical protein [Cyanothece sp. BG0011]
MKSALTYHGKYNTFSEGNSVEISFDSQGIPSSDGIILGVVTQYSRPWISFGGEPEISEPLYDVVVVEGESCPIDGFPPHSRYSNPNELPF